MTTKNYFNRLVAFGAILLTLAAVSTAQNQKTSAPGQDKLLNGLKVLVWREPAAPKATIKLRVNSGAAFDTQNKEGTMALLGDILFPNDSTREFFRDELNGSLDVETNYDFIQITATGNADKILTMLETLANAVVKPQIDKTTTAQVRAAQIERVKELEQNPAYLADQEVAKRLLGTFPYGRSAEGTTESLPKIDFADVLLAKQRFLTADNATLAVSGNVKPEFVFKAARQLFGGWEKADRRVPATFAEPPAPDTNFFLVKSEIENASELRFAFRGLSRGEKDFYAGQILTYVLQNRLRKKEADKALLLQNSYFLPGLVIVKFSKFNSDELKLAANPLSFAENFSNYVDTLLRADITADEFQAAQAEFSKSSQPKMPMDSWLDNITYQLAPNKIDAPSATLADAQRVLERWRKEAVVKTMLIKPAA